MLKERRTNRVNLPPAFPFSLGWPVMAVPSYPPYLQVSLKNQGIPQLAPTMLLTATAQT